MQCSRWEPADQLVGPCADISFSYSTRESVSVTMHFSLTPGLPNRDLVIHFNGVLSLLWELEGPGVSAMPRNLPKCVAPEWKTWTFPLLNVTGSEWLGQYQAIYHNGPTPLAHFLLVSTNDLVQLIARADAVAEWAPGRAHLPALERRA